MITFEQAKTLTEGQVIYTIKENKIKEAKITDIRVFEESSVCPSARCRIFYKLKGGTLEHVAYVSTSYSIFYLTKEEAAKALISNDW